MPDDVRTIYLLVDDPKKYHKFAVAENTIGITRKVALKTSPSAFEKLRSNDSDKGIKVGYYMGLVSATDSRNKPVFFRFRFLPTAVAGTALYSRRGEG